MSKVLISDKISESCLEIFKKNNINVDYKPGLSHSELLNQVAVLTYPQKLPSLPYQYSDSLNPLNDPAAFLIQ